MLKVLLEVTTTYTELGLSRDCNFLAFDLRFEVQIIYEAPEDALDLNVT